MNIIIPSISGFCPGVKKAEYKLFELRKAFPNDPIYLDGFLINNKEYIEYLKTKNILIATDINSLPNNSLFVIRTHGIAKKREQLLRKKFKLIDLTCANVKKVQKEIERFSAQGYFVIIVGNKAHPETLGLVSYAGNGSLVIESEADLEGLKLEFLSDFVKPKLFLCSQTTGSRLLFEQTCQKIKTLIKLTNKIKLFIYNSICLITERKEKEALLLQKQVDYSFVIGDNLSANAKKLYQKLKSEKGEVYFIENLAGLKELKLPLKNTHTGLVVSSASTPDFIEKEIVTYLKSV